MCSQRSRGEEKQRRGLFAIVEPPYKRDCCGRIPLHCAAAAGAGPVVIEMLLDSELYSHDGSCALPEDPTNKDPMRLRETIHGMTPLQLAEKNGHAETVKALGGKSTANFFMDVLSSSRSGTAAGAKEKTDALKKKLAQK